MNFKALRQYFGAYPISFPPANIFMAICSTKFRDWLSTFCAANALSKPLESIFSRLSHITLSIFLIISSILSISHSRRFIIFAEYIFKKYSKDYSITNDKHIFHYLYWIVADKAYVFSLIGS